jgi:DNA-binding beta-propeller fold protein YncE
MRHPLGFLTMLAVLLVAVVPAQPIQHGLAGSTAAASTLAADSAGARTSALPPPQALVTAEDQNQLLVVDLPSGHVARRVTLPADPEDLASRGNGGVVVVVSSSAGAVTVLNRATLRRVKTFGGFDQPHIVAIAPDGEYAYVTDDTRGTLTVIRLSDMTIASSVFVGRGAHHLTFSPDGHRLWVGLGESASQIAILDTTNPVHPRVVGHFSPGFAAHDLAFSPNGKEVWITSATGPDVTVFGAQDRRLLFRVPVGAPPQHLAFDGAYAYLTSGYGATIERVSVATRRVLARARAPYGSFELAAADGYVATSSLLRGTLAIYNLRLQLLRVVTLATASREVVISRP